MPIGKWLIVLLILSVMVFPAVAITCTDDPDSGDTTNTVYSQNHYTMGQSTSQSGSGMFLDSIVFPVFESWDEFNAIVFYGVYGPSCGSDTAIQIVNQSPIRNNSNVDLDFYIGATKIGEGILSYQVDMSNHIIVRVGTTSWYPPEGTTGSQVVKIVRDNITGVNLHMGRADYAYYRYGTLNKTCDKCAYLGNLAGSLAWPGVSTYSCIGQGWDSQVEDTKYWHIEYNRTEHATYNQLEIDKEDPNGRYNTGVEVAVSDDGSTFSVVANATSIYDDLIPFSTGKVERLRLIEPISGYYETFYWGCDLIEDTWNLRVYVNDISKGASIKGASVTKTDLTDGTLTESNTTGAGGYADFTVVQDHEYNISATYTGYSTDYREYTATTAPSIVSLNIYPFSGDSIIEFLVADSDNVKLSGVPITLVSNASGTTSGKFTISGFTYFNTTSGFLYNWKVGDSVTYPDYSPVTGNITATTGATLIEVTLLGIDEDTDSETGPDAEEEESPQQAAEDTMSWVYANIPGLFIVAILFLFLSMMGYNPARRKR